MRIAVTGGTGYIGSHTVVELLQQGHEVVIIDNLSNCSADVPDRIERICGKRPEFVKGNIADTALLNQVFTRQGTEAVMHFAALKAVGESVEQPLRYYDNNVSGTLSLCKAMQACAVPTMLFSSSACVYGTQSVPYTETTPRAPENPYGRTKYIVETMLEDWAASDPHLTAITLRYFNPIGAHPSGLIGENPKGTPNNLMPFISQVASGEHARLNIFGDDYDTADGTAERDYIHVVDLAKGHCAALQHVTTPGFYAYNLGTGKPTSVLQMVHAFEKATGKSIPYTVAPRRPGDLAKYYADAHKAEKELDWQARLGIEAACADTWRWQQYAKNIPN